MFTFWLIVVYCLSNEDVLYKCSWNNRSIAVKVFSVFFFCFRKSLQLHQMHHDFIVENIIGDQMVS